jgi:predicted dehydrogenase
MVKEARKLVHEGFLGPLKKVVVEYVQGWLSPFMVGAEGRPLPWRLDPKRSGPAGSLGDVGTHAEHLVRYVTGLRIEQLCAELRSLVPASPLDTDVNVLVRFEGGAGGLIHASQCLAGEENGLTLRVYGTKGGLVWEQENPNYLVLKDPKGFRTVYSKGGAITSEQARAASFLPVGHPDGYVEAFANIYREAFKAIRARKEGISPPECDYPTVLDGVESMTFVETVLESSRSSSKWVPMRRS